MVTNTVSKLWHIEFVVPRSEVLPILDALADRKVYEVKTKPVKEGSGGEEVAADAPASAGTAIDFARSMLREANGADLHLSAVQAAFKAAGKEPKYANQVMGILTRETKEAKRITRGVY